MYRTDAYAWLLANEKDVCVVPARPTSRRISIWKSRGFSEPLNQPHTHSVDYRRFVDWEPDVELVKRWLKNTTIMYIWTNIKRVSYKWDGFHKKVFFTKNIVKISLNFSHKVKIIKFISGLKKWYQKQSPPSFYNLKEGQS